MKISSRKTSLYGMLLALAMILSYVEAMIPINIGVPGVKLGLPNIVTVIGLYTLGAVPTFIISILRILLVSFMFGNTMTLAYSLSGFALSFLFMTVLIKIGGFQRTVVSITGGVMHNVGQLLAAVLLLHSDALFFYLPVLMVAGVVAGALIGLVSGLIADRIHMYLHQAQNM
ncbi:Gx transporter family protein [Oribacterium sp. FC2011]|uniref:Gx transporter family protein n=1 Tax=Oribacterium sp. FC2011 TaxID=1408311 RepID=UPI0004E1CE56|nr:Gx transporter family protein [Oribacterium sp. FC2011]